MRLLNPRLPKTATLAHASAGHFADIGAGSAEAWAHARANASSAASELTDGSEFGGFLGGRERFWFGFHRSSIAHSHNSGLKQITQVS